MAKARGLAVHVDGARFGNAVAATRGETGGADVEGGVDFL